MGSEHFYMERMRDYVPAEFSGKANNCWCVMYGQPLAYVARDVRIDAQGRLLPSAIVCHTGEALVFCLGLSFC